MKSKLNKSLAALLVGAFFMLFPAMQLFADSTEPLNFTAVGGSATVKLTKTGSPYSINLQYSTDNCTTWNTYSIDQVISLNSGSKVYFKATSTNSNFSKDNSNYYNFVMTGTISADGNTMSLLDATMQQTSVSSYAFYGLFVDCASLIAAPYLPATTLASYCYSNMFSRCTSLTIAPLLPATNLADNCYRYMFIGCSSLTLAPSLPANRLAVSCYSDMFRNCTSLTSAPNLPAGALANYCYSGMFNGCTSLTTPPVLPATTTAEYCYSSMFEYCTSLTSLPELPATILTSHCYSCMFRNCTSLIVNTSGVGKYWLIPTSQSANNATQNMFWNTGGSMSGTPNVNTPYYVASDLQYVPLNFTAKNGSVTITFDIKNVTHTIQYSTNGINWQTYTPNSSIVINANGIIYFRAKSNQTNATAFGQGGSYTTNSMFHFSSSNGGTVEGDGNIMSLYGPDCPMLQLNVQAFRSMFYGCTLLTKSPLLPDTLLAAYCYANMFENCTSLKSTSTLPATTMASHCYMSMFKNCTALNTPPCLPATSLNDYCYSEMFSGCTSLRTAPSLPSDSLSSGCYSSMFSLCSSLKNAPSLPATSLENHCYSYMFNQCISLTNAPELPAQILAASCYQSMFAGCTSLAETPVLSSKSLNSSCYQSMFVSCTLLKSLPELPATKLYDYCYNDMFNGCTSLIINNNAPGTPWKIPATTTPNYSVEGMFDNTSGTMNSTPKVNTTYYIASNLCTVTAIPNNSSRGTVTGGGSYARKDTATLTATPKAGCFFTHWSNGETSESINITVTSDVTLTAYFETNASTAIDDIDNEDAVVVVPNPVNAGATAYIYGDLTDVETVEVLNSVGQVIDSFKPESYPVEVSGISSDGIYFVRLRTTDGKVLIQKLVVK